MFNVNQLAYNAYLKGKNKKYLKVIKFKEEKNKINNESRI